jgi:hypothetical protein
MADKNVNTVNYSRTESSIIKTPGLVSTFIDRIPDAYEKISPEITENPFISPVSKVYYYLLDGESEIKSDTIAHAGMTNEWFYNNSISLG